jgi:aminoglycoside phosphotransferase (APT) family kinase protein
MTDPILKSHWERYKAHVELDLDTVKRLVAPYSTEIITEIQWLSEGCANTNYKISFEGRAPVVLRLYTREKSALAREVSLYRLLIDKIPVPLPLYEDDSCSKFDLPYAIMTWVNGTLMRELILSGDAGAIHDCAFEAGRYLNQIRKITFEQGGFFQADLSVRPFEKQEEYQPFVFGLLDDGIVKNSLGNKLHQITALWVQRHMELLPAKQESNLTHGDFDPANILVQNVNGHWKITAILDWEFAFAGTYFLDMGLFLRYSHKLPNCYEQGFINGIESEHFKLPQTWKAQAKLMDLLCLLNLLHYNPNEARPNLNRDVVALIANTTATNYEF